MAKRRLIWCFLIGVVGVGIMGAGSCGKKAKEQIDAASIAMEDARVAQAPEYAPDEYTSAEESLELAGKQYDNSRYRKAETTAATAETQARLALKRALEEKEKEAKLLAWETEKAAAYHRSTLFDNQPTSDELARASLHDIHFPFDSTQLSVAAKGILALNAQWLTEHSTIKVEIEGHCDSRGGDEYNLALGAKRAKIVYNYMISAGLDPSRIRTISYGESLPLDSAQNEDSWAKNRRVHFAVVR